MSSGISKIIASQSIRLRTVRGRFSFCGRRRSRFYSSVVGSNQATTKSYNSCHRNKSAATNHHHNKNNRAWFYSESFKNYRSSSSTWTPAASAVPASSSFHQEDDDENHDYYDYDDDDNGHKYDSDVEDDFDWELKQLAQENLLQFLPPSPPSPTSQSSTLTPQRILRKLSAGVEQELDYDDYRSFQNIKYDEDYSNDSLSLELGEASVWDQPQSYSLEQEEEDDSDGNTLEEYLHHQSTTTTSTTRKPSAADILLKFDPQNPPDTNDPLELQLWLECEAQQEAVTRYRHMMDQARQRNDFSGLLQRYVLQWFEPMCREIEKKQMEYLSIQQPQQKQQEQQQQQQASPAHRRKAQNIAMKRYGPFLCLISPEKLAVITAHEALMLTLLHGGTNGREGVPFLSLVKRIGEAVEEEFLIQRVLQKRAQETRARHKQSKPKMRGSDDDDDDGLDNLEFFSTPPSEMLDEADTQKETGGPAKIISLSGSYSATHLSRFLKDISRYDNNASKKGQLSAYAVRRARKILRDEKKWSETDKIQVGAALLKILLYHATLRLDDTGPEEMAFIYEKRWHQKQKLKSFIVLNAKLCKMLVSDNLQSLAATTTRHKPMIIPPKPWKTPSDGGYKWLKVDLMRYHGCNTQEEALRKADLTTVFDGLNALGRVAWQINDRILEVAKKCWENDISIGDIPSRTDFDLPPDPGEPPERAPKEMDRKSPEFKAIVEKQRQYREAMAKYRRVKQKNMDLRSLRCSAILKLDQAEKFKDFAKIYFPYNMDFRGRAYPIPPHLSNVGSDLCRGMLKFAESKPLGSRGLFWLKVHLANLAGKDKMSFDDRAAFVDDNMDNVRLSAEDPFAGDRWWMSLDDPFQGLATCIEIVNAIESGNPETYECSLPVHMDGSCNGLQHYAALGRDVVGGRAVNLCAVDEPQDVYIGVMHEVIKRVAEEAERSLDFDTSNLEALTAKQKRAYYNNRSAKLVNGLIDRGVVKRTVMTSVYGVTYIGARQQIQEKIESKLEEKGYDIDEIDNEVFHACGYLARITMDVMGDLFTGAKQTMNWLTTCARLIAQHGYPVAWISPIGLPAIQPYRRKKAAWLVTLMQTVTLTDESDDLPIHRQRQVSAFPPNYVHSLDSSHMLLTALEMDRRGLHFSAVHDSFWTHPCDIDEMNGALRDVFVSLYKQPLLEQLKETWELRYPDVEFPRLPERGKLDLDEVRRAKYFFQ